MLAFIILLIKAVTKRKGWHTYIIKKGSHYASGRAFKLLFKKEIHFTAVFDGTSAYTFSGTDYSDINKLYGFAEGFKNSVRIGWNYKLGMIRLYPYVHRNGKNDGAADPDFFYSCLPDMELKCSIEAKSSLYRITVNDKSIVVPRGKVGKCLRWYLFPYFGGNKTAPNDIKIKIKNR